MDVIFSFYLRVLKDKKNEIPIMKKIIFCKKRKLKIEISLYRYKLKWEIKPKAKQSGSPLPS